MSKNNRPADWVQPLKIAVRLSAWIAFPALLGFILGSYLDRKYGSSPRWFLISIGLAFIVSMFGLIRDALREYQKIERGQDQIKSEKKE